jgi:DNA modification methylase
MDWTNQLYYGDNLRVLREEIAGESVDLVYLDPPFNSAANYNVLFREASGEQSAAHIRDMSKEAVSAGFYKSQWGNFPRLQILTIEDLLTGSADALYPRMSAVTFKRAVRQRRTQGEQDKLF